MIPSGVRYLLDTNILLAHLRGDELGHRIEAAYRLTTLVAGPDIPLISIVTEGEIRSLTTRRHWGAARAAFMNRFLSRLTLIPVDGRDLVNAYVQADVFSEGAGRPLGSKNDLWIAATAHVTGAALLTTDRDFDLLHDNGFLRREWIDPRTTP